MEPLLINHIILSNILPDIFKISRITPISKPGKPLSDIESFRPINNLCTIEKIVEEYIKLHLEKHLNYNNIINKNHHGAEKGIAQQQL